jgi:integrase
MASVSTNKTNGHKRVLIVLGEKRVTIRLGKCSLKDAREFCGHIEKLAGWKYRGLSLADETAAWLNGRGAFLRPKLEAAGIVDPIKAKPKADKPVVPLKAFLQGYLDKRADIKPSTKEKLEIVRDRLIEHFGAERDMLGVNEGDAEDFRLYMIKIGNGENTIRRTIGRARQYFKAAIKRKLIPGPNPFDGLPSAVRGNPARFHFVTREEFQKLIDAAPDAQWRLLIALARYGGLRTPSEPLALTWDRVNWEHNRILIHCPKLERLQGKGDRWIPMFPELLPYLQQAFDEAKTGADHVITRYRDSRCNLRTQIGRIAVKAGVEMWEKPWQNMRATRQTELEETFPSHVVSKWMGNSEKVANEHYLNVTDEHFKRAIQGDKKAAHNPAQLAQKTAQNIAADTGRSGKPEKEKTPQVIETTGFILNHPDSPIMDIVCPSPRVGLEPTTWRLTAARSTY